VPQAIFNIEGLQPRRDVFAPANDCTDLKPQPGLEKKAQPALKGHGFSRAAKAIFNIEGL
jgi:hypothetical protein